MLATDLGVGWGAACARAALVGNPSDGYGGAVIAVTLDQFQARATVRRAREPAAAPASELVAASVRRFAREHCPEALGAAVEWETSVPRGVGLGGSSAIVIATLRALCELHGVTLRRTELATLALAVEREELGIAAGLQDRVAQSYGGLTFMDFGADCRYAQRDARLLPAVVVAWRQDTSAASGIVHGDLRSRFDAGERAVVDSMTRLAEAAREARAALVRGDHAVFAACVDASFDARQRMMDLDERHVAMIERARACGAGANYTGSGGAIAAVCRDDSQCAEVTAALREIGCETVATGASGGAAKPGA
ncbi:MAG: mevalonate kinase family protein [Solirubrobacteraceae bacterium]